MELQQPIWMALAIPLTAAWLLWKLPTRFLRVVRALVCVLVLLAMCRLSIRLPGRNGLVVVLADRSASMPVGSDAAEKELIDIVHSSMRSGDRLAVVAFGRRVSVDHSPQSGKFPGFTADVGREHSDLHGALGAAMSLVGEEKCGRVLVVSDGRWTGKDPAEAATMLAARGLPVDYRLLERASVNDLSVEDVQAPETVLPGQFFMVNAIIKSPVGQDVRYEFRRGKEILAAGVRGMAGGANRLTFREHAPDSGTCRYTVKVTGVSGTDPAPENNIAAFLVGVRGARPVLVVSQGGAESGLARGMRSGSLSVTAKAGTDCAWGLADLAQYSAVVIENVPAGDIGVNGMENLAAWVEHAGGGVMMTGGRNSYGPGGYFKSPLEPVLPVSMELRREHRKLSLAIVVALDRSGSMSMPAGGGKMKMDLANMGTAQVLDLLSPVDEFGVIAVDSSAHTIVNLTTVETQGDARGRVLQIASMGGGIFIYEALANATKMIMKAQAQTKHIVLFADASDSEEPGSYKELLEKARAANITVSVIGLGAPTDCDAELLRDIALRGGGLCFFTVNPGELPRLFAQDTFAVARSTFVEDPTQVKLVPGMKTLTEIAFENPPPLGGYSLCYGRPGANIGAVTVDEYKAPVVASWHAGSGRALCFAGEVEGKFTGEFGRWGAASRFFAVLGSWTAGRAGRLPDNMLVTQTVRDGLYRAELHLDPERSGDPFKGTPRVRFLRGEAGGKPGTGTVMMNWESADLLSAATLMSGEETMIASIEIPGVETVALTPVCMPYSAEFKPDREGRGADALKQIAAATGGKERIEVAGIWKEVARASRYLDMTPFLILAAVLLFIVEVFERRTGLVAVRRRADREGIEEDKPGWKSIIGVRWQGMRRSRKPGRDQTVAESKAEARKEPETKEADPEGGTLGAMRQARRKADERLK